MNLKLAFASLAVIFVSMHAASQETMAMMSRKPVNPEEREARAAKCASAVEARRLAALNQEDVAAPASAAQPAQSNTVSRLEKFKELNEMLRQEAGLTPEYIENLRKGLTTKIIAQSALRQPSSGRVASLYEDRGTQFSTYEHVELALRATLISSEPKLQHLVPHMFG